MDGAATLAVAILMLVMGCGIIAIWTVDMFRNPGIDRSAGLVRAREAESGSLLLPHWLAEYATAGLLIAGGLRLLFGWSVGGWTWLVAVGLGALAYTSLNSLGWALARPERITYAIPMAIGLLGSVASIGLLIAGVIVPSF
jgi:hypothetical protein